MRPFLALVRKDLRLFFSDPRAVLMTIVAPIVIASFFGFIFDDASRKGDAAKVAVLLVDDDASTVSKDIVRRLSGDQSLGVKTASIAEARDAVRRGKAALAVQIPKGFEMAAAAAFFGGGTNPKAPLPVLYDPSHATEAAMVQGVLTGHAMEAVSKEMFSGQSGAAAVDESLARLEHGTNLPDNERAALTALLHGVKDLRQISGSGQASPVAAGGVTMPFVVTKEAVTSRRGTAYNSYAHAFAGMGVQFILFLAIEMGVGLLLQRRDGLWMRLRAAPLSRATLLGARAASTTLLALFVLAALFAFARVAFSVRIEGSAIGFAAVCLSFSLMTATFGLLIASLGRTPEATRGLTIVVTLLMVMLGGAWVPTFVFPRWLQSATAIVPTRWAIDGLDATTWRGLGLAAVWQPIASLLAAAAVFGAAAVGRFRWDTR